MALPVSSNINSDSAYLNFTSELFSAGRRENGLELFARVGDGPKHQVYGKLWLIRGSPPGIDRFGERAFNDSSGYSSSLGEKAQAINHYLRDRYPDPQVLHHFSIRVFQQLFQILDPMERGNPYLGVHAFFHSGEASSSLAQKIRSIELVLRGGSTNITQSYLYLHIASRLFMSPSISGRDNTEMGLSLFGEVDDVYKNSVYEEMWIVDGKPEGNRRYGQETFLSLQHQAGGKARAIQRYLCAQDIPGGLLSELANRVFLTLDRIHNHSHRSRAWEHLYGGVQSDVQQWKAAIDSVWADEVVPGPDLASLEYRYHHPLAYLGENVLAAWVNPTETAFLANCGSDLSLEILNQDEVCVYVASIPKDASSDHLLAHLSSHHVELPPAWITHDPATGFCCEGLSEKVVRHSGDDLRLVKRKEELVWSLYQAPALGRNRYKTISWIPASRIDIQQLGSAIQLLKSQYGEEGSPWKDYEVAYSADNRGLEKVELKKRMFPCLMDATKLIDRDNWSITLVSLGASTLGHAGIVISGVQNGIPFSSLAHLRDTGPRCLILDRPLDSLRCQSTTWVLNRMAVQRIISRTQDRAHFFIIPVHVPYVGQVADNCISWAVARIRDAGVALPQRGPAVGPNAYIAHLAGQAQPQISNEALGFTGDLLLDRSPLCKVGFVIPLSLRPRAL